MKRLRGIGLARSKVAGSNPNEGNSSNKGSTDVPNSNLNNEQAIRSSNAMGRLSLRLNDMFRLSQLSIGGKSTKSSKSKVSAKRTSTGIKSSNGSTRKTSGNGQGSESEIPYKVIQERVKKLLDLLGEMELNAIMKYPSLEGKLVRYRPDVRLLSAADILSDLKYNCQKANEKYLRWLNEQSEHSFRIETRFTGAKSMLFSPQKRNFTCGYRNIQMLLSAVLLHAPHHTITTENYKGTKELVQTALQQLQPDVQAGYTGGDLVKGALLPDVETLQILIERAWQMGFDEAGGKRHFNGDLVGKSEWIGTFEACTVLRSFGIRAEIIDFDFREQTDDAKSSDTHTPFESTIETSQRHFPLTEFCWRYFNKQEVHPVAPSQVRYPLYLQHNGHSRTIVGMERIFNKRTKAFKTNFLLLDPTFKENKIRRSYSYIRIPAHKMSKDQYQIVFVHSIGDDCGVMTSSEVHAHQNLVALIQFT